MRGVIMEGWPGAMTALQPQPEVRAQESYRLRMPQRATEEGFKKNRWDDPPDHDSEEALRIETAREITDHLAAVVRNKRRLRFEFRIVAGQQIPEHLANG